MEPIGGLTALYEVLRRKIGANTESTGHVSKAVRAQRRPPAERVHLEQLEGQIRAKLKEQTPDSLLSAASKRWVIASLLSWEHDAGLQNEPKFSALVRSVQQSIDADIGLKARLERVMERLSR